MHLKFADMSLFQLAERGSKCNKVFAYITEFIRGIGTN